MIAFLKGEIADLTENSVVLDVNGIGYEVLVPGQLLSILGGVGRRVKLYTYMQIREDAAVLFGFLTDDLRFAILADDAKRIAKTPGIGAKTAQKIILELKDKLDLEEAFEKKLASDHITPEAAAAAGSQVVQEAVEALVALGYGSTEALKVVRSVGPADGMDVEAVLKEALKRMAF